MTDRACEHATQYERDGRFFCNRCRIEMTILKPKPETKQPESEEIKLIREMLANNLAQQKILQEQIDLMRGFLNLW